MSLQKLIEKHQNAMIKMLEDAKDGFGRMSINPHQYAAILEAAEYMREQLALMSDGEGSDYRVYMTISKAAIRKADQICKGVEG